SALRAGCLLEIACGCHPFAALPGTCPSAAREAAKACHPPGLDSGFRVFLLLFPKVPEVSMPTLRTLLALLVCASAGLAAEMRTLTSNLPGQLVSITDKEVEFSTQTGSAKTSLSLVLDITLQPVKPLPASTKRVDVELIDGSQFKCKEDGVA